VVERAPSTEALEARDDTSRTLFSTSPDVRFSLRMTSLAVIALALGTLIQIARQTGAGSLATVYAEDGTVFLAGALSHHLGVAAMPEPYMGYVHVLPRMMAAIAIASPLRWAAVVLSGGSALVVSALALLVFRASGGHLRSTLARGLLAATLIFLPVATAEVLDNVANLHWFLIFAAFWILLWKTDHVWEITLGVVVVFLSGASDPLSLLLTPVAVIRVLTLRGLRNHAFTAAWAGGLLLQATGILLGHAHRNLFPPVQPLKVAAWYVFDVLGRAVFGTQLLGSPRSLQGVVLAAVGVLALGALGVAAVRTGMVRDRPLIPLAAGMSVLFFAVPVVLTGISAPRYSVVPILLVLTAVASVLDAPLSARFTAGFLAGRAVAIALLAVVLAVELPVQNLRSEGPTWLEQLSRAQAICSQSAAGGRVVLLIAPPGWHIDAACADLLDR
jgi:hypothetical protein